MSRFVALVTDSGFFTLLVFAFGFALAFLIIRACLFPLFFPFPLEPDSAPSNPWAYGAQLLHEEDPHFGSHLGTSVQSC